MLLDKLIALGFKVGEPIEKRQTFDPNKKHTFIYVRYPGTKSKSLIFKHEKFNDYFKFTEDDFYVHPIGIAFEQNFIHSKLFRDEIEKIFESGITKSKQKKVFDEKNTKNGFTIVEKSIGKKVLSLEDLRAGFVIWFIAVLASIFVFNCEICYFAVKESKTKKKQQLKVKNKAKKSQSIDVKTLEKIDLQLESPLIAKTNKKPGCQCKIDVSQQNSSAQIAKTKEIKNYHQK